MSIQSVEAAAREAQQASVRLRREALAAIHAGVPRASVSRASGISRTTLLRWEREQDER